LVASKIKPLMTLHWWRHALHWKYSRPSRRNELLGRESQDGQAKPSGQREAMSAASHCYCRIARETESSKVPAATALGSLPWFTSCCGEPIFGPDWLTT